MKQFKTFAAIKNTMAKQEQRIFDKLLNAANVESVLRDDKEYQQYMNSEKKSLKEIFKDLRIRRKIKIPGIAKEIGCSSGLIYKIFQEKRHLTREMLIAISVAMRLSLGQTWALLHFCQYRELYVLDPREAVIIHGIGHGKSIGEINKILEEIKKPLLIPCAMSEHQ